MENTSEIKVFVTYSWGNDEHNEKAIELTNFLRNNGFHAEIDKMLVQNETAKDFKTMMHKGMTDYNKVIVILSETYKEKAEEFKGGVGTEYSLILRDIETNSNKYILVSFEGFKDNIIPLFFKSREILDLSKEDEREKEKLFAKLLDKKLYEFMPVASTLPSIETKKTNSLFAKNEILISDTKSVLESFTKKVFKIELTNNFECKQSDLILSDYFTQIKDLLNDGKPYEIEFEIENISEIYRKYEELKKIDNPIENDLKLKLQYRTFLDACFYHGKETIYDKLKEVLENIIIYSYNKYAYIRDVEEVVIAVQNSFKYFSPNPKFKQGKGFDIFEDQNNWNFKIYLNENEVLKLLNIFRPKETSILNNYELLTRLGGLDVYDLNHETLIREAIPKQAFSYVYNNISKEKKEDYFKIGNWKLGLA
ncbi:SEFIR domain-containing protein [Flavobacterium sp.]|uniref:SEFIR domain-containing protein n=1 Tax=Flavobacterium sp. TaxID=239 RepID=UPI0031D55301